MKRRTDRLAVHGGTPVRRQPMPPRRLFAAEEKAAAVEVFDECLATGGVFGYGGPREQAYEKEFAEFLGGGFVKAVNSGTSAVLAALAALELDCGSEVIVPPVTDPGGVMPVAVMNCLPVPADGDGRSFNLGPQQVAAAVTPRTRAVIVAHVLGEPADMEGILEVARGGGLAVIEDCAQAHGATLGGRQVGTFGHVAAFSTMSGKHHATGAQGGLVFTRDENLFWKARRFMDRGKSFGLASAGADNVVLGLNLNSNELSAAIGRAQLRKLPRILQRRRDVAAALSEGMRPLKSVRPGPLLEGSQGSYWFFRVTVDGSRLTVDKDAFASAVQAEGIPVIASYAHMQHQRTWFRQQRTYGASRCPWHCPLYAGPRQPEYRLPNAEAAIAANFLVAIHENWDDQAVNDALTALAKVEAGCLKS